MRVIDAFDDPVRTLAVSPDGRYLAAATARELAIWDWLTGEEVNRQPCYGSVSQLAFTADASWLAFVYLRGNLMLLNLRDRRPTYADTGVYSGGVAVSPDAKTLIATKSGSRHNVKLEQWELPARRLKTGYEYWSPFTHLSFSPNGEFIAGVGPSLFELRIAVSGGLNGQREVNYVGEGFFSFSRDSRTVVFGWESTLHVMETSNGNLTKRVTYLENEMFRDVAFLGSGSQFATIDGTPLLRMWSSDSWQVVRGFDWGAGGLTRLISSADGLAGICGTKNGKLVLFDVDD